MAKAAQSALGKGKQKPPSSPQEEGQEEGAGEGGHVLAENRE
jgi:hypothetical protein